MSRPRKIDPGTTFFVTVRCANRSFRLVPKPEVRDSINYIFKAAAAAFSDRIHIHEFEFLSNHFHILGTDLDACLPAFMRELNRAISRQLNALRGIRGTNIEKGYNLCQVDMFTGDRALEHAVYILTQATAAHLVERASEWKAPNSFATEYGVPESVKRPECGLWSRPNDLRHHPASRRSGRARYAGHSNAPETVVFELVRPPIYAELSDSALRARIRRCVEVREDELIRERRRTGRRVAGWNRVVSRNFLEIPAKGEEYFARVPSFSAATPDRRAALARAHASFRAAYNRALARFIDGVRDVLFPPGTYLMRVVHKAVCADPTPA